MPITRIWLPHGKEKLCVITFELSGHYELMVLDEPEDYDLEDDLHGFFENEEFDDLTEEIIAWAGEHNYKVVFEVEHKCFRDERFVRLLARIPADDAAFHFRMRFGYAVARPIADVREMGR